jgi:hypothetical protein
MTAKMNSNRDPVEWREFLSLCKSLGLEISEPDTQGRYKFMKNDAEVMHQVKKLKNGKLRSSGWFSRQFSGGSEWNGLPLTAGGHVWIIDTLDPKKPINVDHQKSFVAMVGHVLSKKSGKDFLLA